jgi:hypothetical protein
MATIFDGIFAGETGVASTLLDLFGTSLTLEYGATDGSLDPLTGIVTPGTGVSDTTKASPPEPFTISEREGTVIKEGDLKTIAKAYGLTGEPPVGAKATIYSVVYRVAWVGPIYSGDEVSAYTLALRKGA